MSMIKIEDLREVKTLDEVEGLEIRNYVSVLDKAMMVEALVATLVRQDETGMYVVNSIEKEVKRKVAAISLYTNIEITEDDYLNYDIIMQNKLMAKIEEHLDKDDTSYYILNDLVKFYDMLDDRISDKLRENSVERAIASKMNDVIGIIDNTMDHVNDMLDKGDPNKIAKYLSKGIEMIANKLPDLSKLDVTKPIKEQLN